MKRMLLLLCAIVLLGNTMAQTRDKALTTAKRSFFKQHNSRIPQIKTAIPICKDNDKRLTTKGASIGSLPTERVWFAAEWEEVQAIVVAWPYFSVPKNYASLSDPDYWVAEPVFSNLGEIYHYEYNRRSGNYDAVYKGLGEYLQIPYIPDYSISEDYTDDIAFLQVFVDVIDGIQKGNAEAWIVVSNASDTSLIKQYMSSIGRPLTRYQWLINNSNSFWMRDCGPICFYFGDNDSIGMLDFTYYPGRAIDDSIPSLIERTMNIPSYSTSIEWEGGNCLVDGAGLTISSDQIYSANADTLGQMVWDGSDTNSIRYQYKQPLSKSQIRDSLHALIGHRSTKIVPAFQYDGGTGHIDLYADMIDENSFVVSQFPYAYRNWKDYKTAARNIDSMTSWRSLHNDNYRATYIPFPCKDDGSNFRSQTEYNGTYTSTGYTRTYSNHLFVNNVILQPCFSKVVDGEPTYNWDKVRIDSLRAVYRGYTVIPIDVHIFDGMGGAIHCITKQIPSADPIRILHRNIADTISYILHNQLPISAIISTRSDVNKAEVVYRINGGDWQHCPLHANALRYIGTLNLSDNVLQSRTTDTIINVEYYINVLSNSGKTITKPFTSSNGGYYSFSYCYSNNPSNATTPSNYFCDTSAINREDITYIFDVNRSTNSISEVDIEENIGVFYPNPTHNTAHIEIDMAGSRHLNVAIINLQGHTLYHAEVEAQGMIEYTINTQSLPSGVYLVHFSFGKYSAIRKLIVR